MFIVAGGNPQPPPLNDSPGVLVSAMYDLTRFLKTLGGGPAGVLTHSLPLSKLAFFHLRKPHAGVLLILLLKIYKDFREVGPW